MAEIPHDVILNTTNQQKICWKFTQLLFIKLWPRGCCCGGMYPVSFVEEKSKVIKCLGNRRPGRPSWFLAICSKILTCSGLDWIIQSLLLTDRDWIVLPRLSIDRSQFGRAEITVDFIKKNCNHSTITTLFPTYLLTSGQIKYKIDHFHGFFCSNWWHNFHISYYGFHFVSLSAINSMKNDNF